MKSVDLTRMCACQECLIPENDVICPEPDTQYVSGKSRETLSGLRNQAACVHLRFVLFFLGIYVWAQASQLKTLQYGHTSCSGALLKIGGQIPMWTDFSLTPVLPFPLHCTVILTVALSSFAVGFETTQNGFVTEEDQASREGRRMPV